MRSAAILLALAAVAPWTTGCKSPAAAKVEDDASLRRELSVGFVVVDGVYDTELVLPLDVFHHTVFHAQPGMKVFTVASSIEPLTTFEGLRLIPDHTFDDAPAIDVLVVASAKHSMDTDLENAALIQFVRERGSKARYVLSLCDGSFVLARAGLLDGRWSTTFPADVAAMRKMFPRLRVLGDVSFVHDGPAITSAGGAKSAEAALYLTEMLYGTKAAREVALGLCIDWDLARVLHVTR